MGQATKAGFAGKHEVSKGQIHLRIFKPTVKHTKLLKLPITEEKKKLQF